MLQAAETMDRLARLHQVACFRGIASQFQSEIRFARRIQLGRPARIDGPAAIGELPAAHVICQLGNALGISLAQNVQVIDVVGFERGVCFEFALPVSFLCLNGKEVIRAALNRFFQARSPLLLLPRQGRGRDGDSFTHSGE